MNLNPFQIVLKSVFGSDSQSKNSLQFTFAFLTTPIWDVREMCILDFLP